MIINYGVCVRKQVKETSFQNQDRLLVHLFHDYVKNFLYPNFTQRNYTGKLEGILAANTNRVRYGTW
jgi:hypothetical protein